MSSYGCANHPGCCLRLPVKFDFDKKIVLHVLTGGGVLSSIYVVMERYCMKVFCLTDHDKLALLVFGCAGVRYGWC